MFSPSTIFILCTVLILLICLNMYSIIQNNEKEVSEKIKKLDLIGILLSSIGGFLSFVFLILFASSYIEKLKDFTQILVDFIGGRQMVVVYFVISLLLSIFGGMILGTKNKIYPTVNGMTNTEQQLLELSTYTFYLTFIGCVSLGFYAGKKLPIELN